MSKIPQESDDAARVTIRRPYALSCASQQSGPAAQQHHQQPPSIAFLTSSPWNVTYSTLPMWKSKRNVRITYRLLSPPSSSSSQQQAVTDLCLDDLVTYQNIGAKDQSAMKQIQGVDRAVDSSPASDSTSTSTSPSTISSSWAWKWRGSGWLKIASSRWEILGYGTCRDPDDDNDDFPIDWAVTYFAKTLFTPAGIDVYSRPKAAVSSELLEKIKNGLKATGRMELSRLADELFPVQHDG